MGRPSIYKVGDRYGGLEILEVISSNISGKHTKLKCLCYYCNTISVKSSTNIKKRNSCGCQQRISSSWKNKGPKTIPRQLPFGEAAKNNLEHQYKRSAKKRNLEYNLTNEQFLDLVKSKCYYCGEEGTSIKKGLGKSSGDFYYVGIDRVDNTKGYLLENCVSCCWKCNNMKHTLNQKDFFDHISKIYKNKQYDNTN